MPFKSGALFAQRGTGKRLPDHLRHPGLKAVELLELVSIGHELINGPDPLLPQRLPGNARQIETGLASKKILLANSLFGGAVEARSAFRL